jgi:cyclic pyranopterin phosphate synthase
MSVADSFNRPLGNLRLSVTDRCNLRCAYCMPEQEYSWLPREDVLSFEEISRIVDAFAALGVDRVRITGGEPLLRRELDQLVALLSKKPALKDIALTTNGVLLQEQATALAKAGLDRITVSLDTLRADRFETLTRRPDLGRVLAGIAAADSAGLAPLKLDTVVMRGTNDDELEDLIEFGRGANAEVRFIEYMDVGGATHWSRERVVSRDEMLARLTQSYGPIQPVQESTSAPADRYLLPDGTTFGIIASVTQPFCATCDRSRLTADGGWYRCLYATQGTDLRAPLRAGETTRELATRIAEGWRARADRGAEERLSQRSRSSFVPVEELKKNPHLEMHTRGG